MKAENAFKLDDSNQTFYGLICNLLCLNNSMVCVYDTNKNKKDTQNGFFFTINSTPISVLCHNF